MNTVYKIVRKEYFLILTLLFLSGNGFAQIGAPTFGFSQICASPTFNSYTANFTFSAANTYTLEMSDASGSFATLTPISILSSQTATSPGSFTFSVPTTTAGQGYKLRVRGSSPATTGANSATFAAYYQIYPGGFYINDKVSNVNICGGGNFTLAIDNPTPNIQSSSPANYPSLKYKWFRNDVQLPGEFGTSITINTAGTYRCEIDYGSCSTVSSPTVSQNVTVNTVATGSTFTITSSAGNALCAPASTTLSTTEGYTYQWFKDSVLISGATNYNYVTNQPGAYNVLVNQGGCSSTSNTLNITTSGITATLNVPTTSTIVEGEIKTIIVTTNASNPTYQWYDSNGPIVGETSSSFSTGIPGDYKVVVTQTTGCNLNAEIPFTLRLGIKPTKIPNTISANGDSVNDFWEIPEEYQTEDTEVMIVDSYGKMVLQKKNYQNNWPESAIEFKSVNPVFYYIITKQGGEVKKGSITVIK